MRPRTLLAALVVSSTLVAALGCSGGDPGGGVQSFHPGPQPTHTGTPNPNPTTTPTATSTGTTPPPPPPPPTTTDQTWADGKQVTSSVVIGAGTTLTIAPGATVTIADGATITVQGTMTASSQTTHAKLTGNAWGGIIVGTGGTMKLVGVDIVNATNALVVNADSTSAEYDYGTIGSPTTAFNVAGKLTMQYATVTKCKGSSTVSGALTASHLDYDSNGNEGMTTSGATAVLTIDDSTLHGTGPYADMIVSSAASSIHIGHSEIKNTHCAFHFNAVDSFDLTYMTIHDNAYGFMLYGSGTKGTRSITYSNIFSNSAYGADEGSASTVNGLITISNGYWATNGTDVRKTTNAITVTNMSTTTPVPTAGPRS